MFCGLNVGKYEHEACAVDASGKGLRDKPLPKDESALRTVLTGLPTLADRQPALVRRCRRHVLVAATPTALRQPRTLARPPGQAAINAWSRTNSIQLRLWS